MIALLQSRSLTPDPITLDTELRLCLHPLDRVYSLPIWVEEATGRDAEKAARKWTTVGDVMEWMDQCDAFMITRNGPMQDCNPCTGPDHEREGAAL